ncbi:hypothetical protein CRG98_032198 [Punica granatum]|uniref:Uncharacterized protein n=1 Tax=Punica granatum TaxID=22663 RepID=A0A2I0IUC6_PUNGR|nr:hypothetical protein CRG98_032198 [Punica granatum]
MESGFASRNSGRAEDLDARSSSSRACCSDNAAGGGGSALAAGSFPANEMAAARSTAAAAEFSMARRIGFFGEEEGGRASGTEDEQALMDFWPVEEKSRSFGGTTALTFEEGEGKVRVFGAEAKGDVVRRKEEEGRLVRAEFMAVAESGNPESYGGGRLGFLSPTPTPHSPSRWWLVAMADTAGSDCSVAYLANFSLLSLIGCVDDRHRVRWQPPIQTSRSLSDTVSHIHRRTLQGSKPESDADEGYRAGSGESERCVGFGAFADGGSGESDETEADGTSTACDA